MACFSKTGIRIAGISASIPKQSVSNHDFEILSEKERKLFIRMTGIEHRRLAPAGMTASDLCQAAAATLLRDLGWDPAEIDVLLFVTQSPDYVLPATAMLLQDKLGLPNSCLAFDINQGCAGYVYGLAAIAGFLSGGGLKKGLLLVGDTITHHLNPNDKSTAPIFSDAGSATALVFDESAEGIHFNLQTDGAGYQAIIVPEGGARNKISPESFREEELEPGICRSPSQMAMRGLDVSNFALREVVPNVQALLEYVRTSAEYIDYFVFHQANLLLNESLRKKLKLEKEKVPYTLHKYGNTSCATIPLTLVSELGPQLRTESLNLLLSGFGVGLSWGSATVQVKEIVCPDLVEL